jgi:hypothetical protein
MTDYPYITQLEKQLAELKLEARWYKSTVLDLQRQLDMQQGSATVPDALTEVRQLRTEMMQLFAQVLVALEALMAAKGDNHE